jgi:hypothetical protein
MKLTPSVLGLLFILAFSCSEKSAEPDPRINQPEAFKNLLDAHGDWNQWIDAKSFSFNMVHETNLSWENHYVDLVGRRVRIDGDTWQIGNDGEKVWISPNRQAFQGQSVRFYHNLYFYFYSIPYIFTDPGVNVKITEPKTLNGISYEAFEVTFDEGKGDSSGDQYFILIDPETDRLAWLLYKVTFFDKNNQRFNALKYEDYRDAGGLVFPRILTGYTMENDSTKDIRYQVSFTGPLLVNEPMDEKLFKMPEKNAVVAN